MLKLVALSGRSRQLKTRAATIIRNSFKLALTKLEALHIFDFEEMVFSVSRDEGVWEPDTLFRLFSIYQRLDARELAKNDSRPQKLVDRVRNVSDINVQPTGVAKTNCWKVQRVEMYEESDYINKHYMPIELGDIFERAEGGKQYILVAQPGDLMVRHNGERANGVNEVLLLELLTSEHSGNPAYHELPHYDLTAGSSVYVSFNRKHSVKLSVLDLCAYQLDGAARFSLDGECADQVIASWKEHHSKIKKEFEKYLAIYERIDSAGLKGDLLKTVRILARPCSSNHNLFKAKIDLASKQIAFGFRRVRRLSQPQAAALLTQFGNYSSRSAFDVDLARASKQQN